MYGNVSYTIRKSIGPVKLSGYSINADYLISSRLNHRTPKRVCYRIPSGVTVESWQVIYPTRTSVLLHCSDCKGIILAFERKQSRCASWERPDLHYFLNGQAIRCERPLSCPRHECGTRYRPRRLCSMTLICRGQVERSGCKSG